MEPVFDAIGWNICVVGDVFSTEKLNEDADPLALHVLFPLLFVCDMD
jgi:hypothetical protein